MQALQEQRAERKKVADREYSIERQGDSVEEKDLNELWKRESLKLMLFACEHGTVDVVKYFVTELVRPNKGWVIIISVMGNFGIAIPSTARKKKKIRHHSIMLQWQESMKLWHTCSVSMKFLQTVKRYMLLLM